TFTPFSQPPAMMETSRRAAVRDGLDITGIDAEAQRCRGSQRQHDNEAVLFSALFSAPQRLCVKILKFQTNSSRLDAPAATIHFTCTGGTQWFVGDLF